MIRKYLITLTLLILYISTFSQQKLTVDAVDKKSYELFTGKKWKELAEYGTNARSSGIDFYYLQYRIAIAFYELKQYRKAINYFKEIYENNNSDEIAAEYLYYSYIFSGRKDDADILSSKFSTSFADKLNIMQNKIIKSIELSGGYLTTNSDITNNFDNKLLDNQYFSTTGIDFLLSTSTQISFSINYLLLNYSFNLPNIPDNRKKTQAEQFELYFGYKKSYNNGMSLNLSMNYIKSNVDIVTPPQGNNNSKTSSSTDYAFHAGITKDFSLVRLGFSQSLLLLNNYKRLQSNFQISVYPFFNTNFYIIPEFNYFYDLKPIPDYLSDNYYFKTTIGGKILKNTYLETFATLGKHSLFAENNGKLVVNDIYSLLNKYGTNLYIYFKHIVLSFGYQYQIKNTNLVYNNSTNSNLYQSYNFSNHIITGGLKWNF